MPDQIMLKPVVMNKTNYRDYDTSMERRTCPTLEGMGDN